MTCRSPAGLLAGCFCIYPELLCLNRSCGGIQEIVARGVTLVPVIARCHGTQLN